MIVDAHLHVWNRLDGKIGNQTPVVPLGDGMIRIGEREMLGMPAYLLDCRALADYVVSEFNAAGVDMGVVVQDYMDGVQNDYLLDVLAAFPGRFFAHALPNYWDADRVVQETEALFHQGFRGLKLPAEHLLGKIKLDDPRLMQIWSVMEERECVLAVDLSEGQEQVAEMESILKSFPKLRVALGHFGMVNRGGWPEQLMLARHNNVYLETGGIIWLYRLEGFPFPGALDAIARAKQEVGIQKLMWGSDWPRTMIDFTYRQSLDFVRRATGLTENEKQSLLGGNARQLYGIPEPNVSRQPVPLITEE
jgi:L-galactono-1,5-lactonase